MIYIIAYFLVLVLLILTYLARNKFSLSHYFVFNRSGGIFEVSMSIVALVFGASSVFGLSGWGYKFGWNALWWILPGVIGLILLSILFAKNIYSLKGITISDIIEKNFGVEIKVISSAILFVAWLSVLAGQIIAGGNITSYLLGGNKILGYVTFTAIFAFYTVIYGQVSTMRTGHLQVLLMLVAIFTLIISIYKQINISEVKELSDIGFHFDDKFTFDFWLSLFITILLSYLFGPDIYSRIFSSNSEKTAKLSLIISSLLILIIATLIVIIGILSKYYLQSVVNPDNIMLEVSFKALPEYLKPIMIVFLISIPLSGADIILITVTALLVRDVISNIIVKQEIKESIMSLNFVRIFSILSITLGLLIAIYGKDIISTLMTAYKIFSNSIIPFIFVSLVLINTNTNISLKKPKKVILVLLLLLTGSYSILAEMVIPQLKFRFYEISLILISLLVISLIILIKRPKTPYTENSENIIVR